MANFPGGSAFGMVQQVMEGYILITERHFRRLRRGELEKLSQELEKQLRTIRGDQPAIDDTENVRIRNRRIQRLNQTRLMLQTFRLRSRR